jgi:serpin B
MPKFRARTSLDLQRVLIDLGLGHAFGGDSDFTAIAAAPPLVISRVFHEARIDVDERGTEAAAATAVVMMERGAPPRVDHRFDVDRSFLFFVHDIAGNVLFGGRMLDPSR